jgi:hypothetical protein
MSSEDGTEARPAGARGFWHTRWRVLAFSVLLLVPCVWHQRIEAGDLGSHVYNAWLAQQIKNGQAPGVYLVSQWHNVLFDVALERSAALLGWAVAEKLVVGAAVLVFFWGAFAFVSAAAKRVPWGLAPALAMVAYGWTFQMGFMNYYISLGLAFLSAGLLWRGRGWMRVLAVAVLPVIWLAHPLGMLWLIAALAYIWIRERIPGWYRLILPVAAVLALVATHWRIVELFHYQADWVEAPFYLFNGADQFALFGERYVVLAAAVFVVCAALVVSEVVRRRLTREDWKTIAVPLEMYLVAVCAAGLLPQNLTVTLYPSPMGLLVSRMTTVTAVLGLCVLACLRPRIWASVGLAACAAVYFAFLYQDTSVLNRLEAHAERLVSALPPGQRVLATIDAPQESRVPFVNHVVDRACVGRCFSFGNYEPASLQFRVRVREGSSVAASSADDAEDMASGDYVVEEETLPMFEIYQCDRKDWTKLCIRALTAGEENGRIGNEPSK